MRFYIFKSHCLETRRKTTIMNLQSNKKIMLNLDIDNKKQNVSQIYLLDQGFMHMKC